MEKIAVEEMGKRMRRTRGAEVEIINQGTSSVSQRKEDGPVILVLYGDMDQFTSFSSYQSWIHRLNSNVQSRIDKEVASVGSVPINEIIKVVTMEGGNHNWGSRRAMGEMVKAVREFIG